VALEQARSREAERQLQADREIALQSFRHIADGVVVFDDEFRVVAVNPAFERIAGASEEELLGTTPWQFAPEGMVPKLKHDVIERLDAGKSWHGEIPGRRRNGEMFPMLLTFSRVPDGRIVATLTDVSVSRDYENRLAFLAQHDALTQLA